MVIRPVTDVDEYVKVQNILISVSDKSKLEEFISGLYSGILPSSPRIFSTGGTYNKLKDIIGKENQNKLIDISKYTGMPETEGGLVKTLHPKIYLGLLTETHCEEHQKDMKREGAIPIDLVICNLYPFSDVVKKEKVTFEDARGNVDIGGPTMIRAAAKNFHRVGVVVDPNDYDKILNVLGLWKGNLNWDIRVELMKKAFKHTAEYDAAINKYMEGVDSFNIRKEYTLHGVG